MDLNVLGNYNSSICLALRSGNRFASLALSIATSGGRLQVAGGCPLFVAQLYVMSFGKYEFCSTCAYFSFSISHHVERKAQREWPRRGCEDDAEDADETDERQTKNDRSGLQLRVAKLRRKCLQWGRQCIMKLAIHDLHTLHIHCGCLTCSNTIRYCFFSPFWNAQFIFV